MADVRVTSDGSIDVTFDDGASFNFSDADQWGVGPSLDNWHNYSVTETVGRLSDGFTVQGVWEGLLNGPAPGSLLNSGPAVTGSITDTWGPGGVSEL